MTVVAIHPQSIAGKWTSGIALDFHTTSSTPVGHNEFGHMQSIRSGQRSPNSSISSNIEAIKAQRGPSSTLRRTSSVRIAASLTSSFPCRLQPSAPYSRSWFS